MAASWPTSIPTDATLYVAVNELQTNLSAGINAAVTSIPLNSTTGFPTVGLVLIDNEIIKYTGVSGGNLTGATRGFDGTTAASHSSAAVVSFAICAQHHNVTKDEIIALATYLSNNLGTGAQPLANGSRALASNGSGKIIESSVTSTELGYLAGVTSAVQTQLSAKIANPMTGDLAAGSHKITGLTNGSADDEVVNFGQLKANLINILDNGGFEIWQRGVTFTGLADDAYCADRWKGRKSGGTPPTYTVTQDTGIDGAGTYCLKVNITAAGSTSPRMAIQQWMEVDGRFHSKTVTFTIRAKTSLAGLKIYMNDSVTGNTFGTTHTGGGAYETLTVTGTVNAAATYLIFGIGFGDPILAQGNTVPGTGNFFIDNAMLVFGSESVAFVPGNPQVELARCQRFYQRFGGASLENIGVGQCYTTTNAFVTLIYPVPMRTTPTITLNAPTHFTLFNAAASVIALTSMSASAGSGLGPRSVGISAVVASGLVAGNATILSVASGQTDATIELSADL